MKKDQLEKFTCPACGRNIQALVSQEDGELKVTEIIEFCRSCGDYKFFKRTGEKLQGDSVISSDVLSMWQVSKTESVKKEETDE